MRIVVILDKDNTINAGDIFTYINTTNVVNSPYAKDNKYNYRVLMDRRFSPNANKPMIMFSKNFRIQKKVQFEAATTTILYNAIKVFVYSSNAGNAQDKPNVRFVTRCYYTDN